MKVEVAVPNSPFDLRGHKAVLTDTPLPPHPVI